jgi:hypothetical protein
MPTIVTHIRPHLDEICAIWLLRRYLPAWRDASVEFVHTDELEPPIIDNDERVHVGVGRGQFDEHKGDLGECAASLVYRHLNESVVLNQNERKALDRLVEWVRQEDNGQLMALPGREFSVPAVLAGHYTGKGSESQELLDFGSQVMDALLIGMRLEVELDVDWENRQELDTPYGKTVALVSDTRGKIDARAYSQGFDVLVRISPSGDYAEIRARAGTDIDLTPVRDALKTADVGADWFFHHSKKLLICGGELTGHARTTSLELPALLQLIQESK